MDLNLSPRQASILKAIIRHYVATAEPVGSKVLVKEYDIGASPATVRNTMGRLEKVGLLYQPHTSAGRIPSDSGYRVYVDHYLYPLESEAIAAERDFAERILNERLSHESLGTRFRLNHLDLLLKGAAQILAELSGCIALITLPQAPLSKVHQIRLLPMEPGKIMALLVTQTYESYSSLITLSPPISEPRSPAETMDPNPWEGLDPEHLNQELSLVSNFLSCQLQNHTVGDLSTLDWQELGKQFEHYGDFLQVLLQELSQQAIPTPSNTKIMIGGVSTVLRQPEFTELEQVQTLLHLLEEEQDHLSALIYGASPPPTQRTQRQVTVRIGSENPWEPIQNYSLISSQYGDSTNHWGSVGLLGPTRMDYDTAIALVDSTAEFLSEAVTPSI